MSVLTDFFGHVGVGLPAKDAQDVVLTNLPEAIAQSGLRLGAGDILPRGMVVRVGVQASWNLYDRDLLVFLEHAVADFRTMGDALEVVLVDEFDTAEAVLDWFPDLDLPVTVGPFLGVWRDGELWFCSHGSSANAWLTDRYREVAE